MRNIVICCDGTDHQFGRCNTNVIHLLQALERHSHGQKFFYTPGVGTFAARFFGLNVGTTLGRLLGSAFGYGIRQSLEQAYRYLMNEYEEGDRVFIFGFSRGAFIARSLASMLDACGLLYPHHENMISTVSDYYLNNASLAQLDDFRRTFTRPCPPHFVGVWDTIGALGVLLSMRRFHTAKLAPGVANAFHAVAIDERRGPFVPALWDEHDIGDDQHVEQVWFAGVHGDIGGSYRERGLADIALHWMLEKARERGLELTDNALEQLTPDPLGTLHHGRTGWWRLLGRHVRELPEGARLHPSVHERLSAMPAYSPSNLPSARHDHGSAD
ncbi:putative alpha/beta hydrolase family protein DUF2235 [Kushneria sinocarnis]|uniref:Putative alpha/beta hydrolase family protein DUF2235 n=1 Tax=Kushneria sinocarnis TaxID=595502 RepID=A0A420WW95_9GAMM|nr:DUF2235 domain-containing protein [Kushneria sinocarnis]RKR03384.1 putative alpha/beta hydrolase family protein DUF2235 [Kushneria sinocarnis]